MKNSLLGSKSSTPASLILAASGAAIGSVAHYTLRSNQCHPQNVPGNESLVWLKVSGLRLTIITRPSLKLLPISCCCLESWRSCGYCSRGPVPHGYPGSRSHAMAMLVSEGYVVSGAMVLSWSELLQRAISGFMALRQPGSVLTSVAPETIEANVDAKGLGHRLWPCWCLRASLPQSHVNLSGPCCHLGLL